MTEFTKTKLTNKGLALLAKSGVEVTITKIETGNGQYATDEDISDMTKIKSKKQQFLVSSVSKKEDTVCAIKFVISNKGLDESYLLTEIGVYANDPDEGEILYAMCYATNNNAEIIKKFSGTFAFHIVVVLNVHVNSGTALKIIYGGAYALTEDLEAVSQKLQMHIKASDENFLNLTNKQNETDEKLQSIEENEKLIAQTIGEEIRRAKEAEKTNADAINTMKEVNDKTVSEVQLAIGNEVVRAKKAEQSISEALNEFKTGTEEKFNQTAEKNNELEQSIASEIERAKEVEEKHAKAISELDTRVEELENGSGGGSSGSGKNYKFSDSDSIKMNVETIVPDGDEDTATKILQITAAIKDAAITKEMLSEEVLALFSDDTLKKKYKQALDDIYDALVSRGLVFPKENIEDYANQIRNLKMIDLNLTFTDNINKCIDVSIPTGEIDAIVGMTDNIVTNVSVPAASRLTENLTELTNISIPTTVVTVVDNLTENVTTE